jgi:hypothetical protein
MRNLALIIIAAIAILSTVVYASSVSVATSTYQAQSGVYYQVTGNIGAQGLGFTVAQSASTASAQPCMWSSGGVCTTAVTAGDWVYTVMITLENGVTPGDTYTVTVSWDTGSGYVQMGSLTFTAPSTVTAGQTMNFVFDTGSTSFNAPVGIVITVA